MRVLVVAAWDDTRDSFVKVIRDAGHDAIGYGPPGEDEPNIDPTSFEVAVVDMKGLSPARDSLRVVEGLIRSTKFPKVLTNTAQIERLIEQSDRIPGRRPSQNVRNLPKRWRQIKESGSVSTSEYTSPSDLMNGLLDSDEDMDGES
jgi:hypothetical protein